MSRKKAVDAETPSLPTASHLNHPSSSASASIRDSVPFGNERIRREDDIRSDPSGERDPFRDSGEKQIVPEEECHQDSEHFYRG